MLRNACVSICCLLLPLLVSAQQAQFKEWRFDVPAGWQLEPHGSDASLVPASAPAGTVYIKLFPGETLSGSLQTWIETMAAQDTQGMTVLRDNPVAPFQTSGHSALQKLVALQTKDGQKAVRMYIGQSPAAGRGELLVFHADLTEAKSYTPVLNNFVNTVHFSGAPAPGGKDTVTTPVAPPSGSPANGSPPNGSVGAGFSGSQLDGFYAQSRQRTVAGPSFTFTMKTVWYYYRFFPDGWVYTSFPKGSSPDSLRCPQAGTGVDQCERYAIRGRTITIGAEKPESFESVTPTEIRISGEPTWLLRPPATALSGTYESVGGGGMLGTASLSIKELTFLPDGRFNSSGSTGVSSTTSHSSATGYHGNSGAGRYRINGYEITLAYSSGAVVKERILAPTDNDPSFLVIGSNNFVKKDR